MGPFSIAYWFANQETPQNSLYPDRASNQTPQKYGTEWLSTSLSCTD